MPTDRRALIAAAAGLTALVLLVWSCSGSTGSDGGGETTVASEAIDGSGEPAADPEASPEDPDAPPAFIPVPGGTNEDGQPEPPPIHAVFSVVVRGNTSWAPYAGPELTGLDEIATRAIASRLRQIDRLLRDAGIPASIELAYGPVSALCAVDPAVLTSLERNGHRIATHARSNGEVFRTHDALAECGRTPTTVSGLASIADPVGPEPASVDSLVEAMSVLSVLDLHQVVGRVSPTCTDLGLSRPTHGYGTGSFTAPWRSAWTTGNPCADINTGRIVVIDQTLLAPVDGAPRVTAASLSILANRSDQMMAYALDQRFGEPIDLPLPGVITWGISVLLDDLIAPPPDDEDAEAPPAAEDPRIALLSDDTLGALSELIEQWRPTMDQGRLRWMLPDDVAEILRPLRNNDAASEGS